MNTHRSMLLLGTAALAVALHAAPVSAEPQIIPSGPSVTDNQEVSLSALRSYDQLWETLRQIEQESRGAMTLAPASERSNLGRDIPVATIGHGPAGILLIAQQHGNEIVVSQAAVQLARDLSTEAAWARDVREALTVTMVPRVNVDGFDGPVQDAFGTPTPWRENYDPFCTVPPCPAFYQPGRGYDINRYHSYLLDDPTDDPTTPAIDWNPVPEARAIRALFDAIRPAVVMDLHHQGTFVDDDGQLITASTFWPNATATATRIGRAAEFADAVILSKKVIATLVTSLAQGGFANVSRYPATSPPGIARNAYGLLGAGSVLVEMWGPIGSKSSGHITRIAYDTMRSVVEALADGSLHDTNVAVAEALPPRGDLVTRSPGNDGEESDSE